MIQGRTGPDSPISCLIDTSVVVDLLRGRESAKDLLSSWERRGELAISVLTEYEVYKGLRQDREESTRALFASLASIEVGREIARLAGTMVGDMWRQGRPVAPIDGLIAATALTLDVPLLSNDADHYLFPGLTVVSGR